MTTEYFYDTYDYKHQSENIDDEIEELTEKMDTLEQQINNLWNDIIRPYIDNKNKCQILTEFRECDYDKFYNFFINNNKIYKYHRNRLNYLTYMKNNSKYN